jgi:hypothetical protein
MVSSIVSDGFRRGRTIAVTTTSIVAAIAYYTSLSAFRLLRQVFQVQSPEKRPMSNTATRLRATRIMDPLVINLTPRIRVPNRSELCSILEPCRNQMRTSRDATFRPLCARKLRSRAMTGHHPGSLSQAPSCFSSVLHVSTGAGSR